MYSKTWTDFETQALAFGLLRKSLYPIYLTRGEHGYLRIYAPTLDQNNPTLLLIIKIEASSSKEDVCFTSMGEMENTPIYLLKGGDKAYGIVELVRPLLGASR